MALSPADFYAYSNATGIPVPEDPQERARIAPDVIEFRRNQLKAPEQESNPLATLGAIAAGAGALAGLGFGARALLGRGRQIPQGPPKSATAGVRQVNLADMEQAVRRVASEPAPSSPPPTQRRSVMPTEEEALQQFNRQLSGAIPEPTAAEMNFPAATSRMYGAGYRERQGEPGYRSNVLASLEKLYPPSEDVRAARRAVGTQDLISAANRLQEDAATLTDIQKTQLPSTSNQFFNAVESGEDQTTGRLIQKLNISDPWGEGTVPPAMVNEQQITPLLPAAAVSPREKAQQFLQTRFEELGASIPGRYRRERAMGQDPAIAEAMELYASTGDPAVLSRLSETPSSPLTVLPRVQTELKEKEEIPTGMFYKTTGRPEDVGNLIAEDIDLTNKISSLGAQQQNVISRLEEIDQLEPQLRFAAADEPEQGGYYSKLLNKMMFEKQNLPDPTSLTVDIGDAMAERDYVRSRMESLESLGPTYKMVERGEGVRPFFQADPVSNEPIAGTLEIRTGRPSVQLEEQKTGGGRNYAMYDPGAQTGSSIGIYGVEPRDFPIADPEIRPTALQREETKMTVRRGDFPKFKTSITSTPEQKRRSLDVSEAMRRARIEGRDPQSVLKQFGIGI